jgi:lipopolysaccharide export system protein LptA
MTSDRLILTEVILSGKRWIEVQATGRVLAESHNLTAEAASIRYTSDKEVVTIEGNARSPLHVWWRKAIGEKPTTLTGNKISYYPRTNEVDLESINHIDLQSLPRGIKLPGFGQ